MCVCVCVCVCVRFSCGLYELLTNAYIYVCVCVCVRLSSALYYKQIAIINDYSRLDSK